MMMNGRRSVEDDVPFRTESGWRERTKLLMSEIQRWYFGEATMMEKGEAEATLKDVRND